jgi:hypothetical protein
MTATVTDLEPLQAQTQEDSAVWLSNVAGDPVSFVEQGLPWGEGELAGSSGPELWQRSILESVRDGLPLGKAIQVAVASGHGVGKTALICWLALWGMATCPDTRGIITAATEPMLQTRVRAELRKWFRLFKASEFFELTATALITRDGAHEQTWRLQLIRRLMWSAFGR